MNLLIIYMEEDEFGTRIIIIIIIVHSTALLIK